MNFLNNERFPNMNALYANSVNKLMKLVNDAAPSKLMKIKNNLEEWFNREVAKMRETRERLIKKLAILQQYHELASSKGSGKEFLRE